MRIHFKSKGKHRIVDLDITFEEFMEAGGEDAFSAMKDTLKDMDMPVDGALMVVL